MKTCLVNLMAACVALSLSGCVSSPPHTVVVPQHVQLEPPVGIEDVKALAKAGVGDEVIIGQIRNTSTVYHLGVADIIALKSAGVSEKVIDFMINTPTSVVPPPTPVVKTYEVDTGPTYVMTPWFWPYWGWGWYGGHGYGGYGRGHWR